MTTSAPSRIANNSMVKHDTPDNTHRNPDSATKRWVKPRGNILANHCPALNPSDDHAQGYNHRTGSQIN